MDREIIQATRILIVDDTLANIELLERVLQLAGYKEISRTTDPRNALELFGVYKPDLILLDWMMPHVDGLSLMKQLRSRIPDGHYLPIIVLTADVTVNAKRQALSLGAKDFLAKPFDITEITLRVNNLAETRWLYKQLQERLRVLEDANSRADRPADTPVQSGSASGLQ
jgi:putative two-component system response regulator